MRTFLFAVFILVLCIGSMGAGYVIGGSNLGPLGYPDYSNFKPNKPYSDDEFTAKRYKREVEEYVNGAKEYVENAQNDRKRINAAIEDAIDAANGVVEEYNSWVDRGW